MADQYHAGAVAATLKSKKNKVCSKFAAVFESNVGNKSKILIEPQTDVETEQKLERKPRKRKVNTDNLTKKKSKKIKIDDDPSINLRTIFVGNVPNTTNEKILRDLFKPYGKIETIRYRSAPTPDIKTSKKVAIIHKNFNPNRHNVNAFVKFEAPESAEMARELNGHQLNGFVLRVDLASNKNQSDHKKSIFVGNLPFDVEENSLHEHFCEYGDIESVRIVRDTTSGIGKGFGYVNFKSEDCVHLALKIAAKPLNGRPLRVSRAMSREKLDKKKRNVPVANKPSGKANYANKSAKNVTFQGETAKLKVKKKKKRKEKPLGQISKNKKIYFSD